MASGTTQISEYDFVIVGGGTAGLAVAARLTEDPNITVCVLEAGKASANPEYNIPGLTFKSWEDPSIDWGFKSVPQAGANGRIINLNRGKMLGGSSCTNYMVLGRGHAEEYNAIEKLGGKGWNWKDLVEYFKKSETFSLTKAEAEEYAIAFDERCDGKTGPIQRITSRFFPELNKCFLKAMSALGFPFNPQHNDGDNTGVTVSFHAIDPKVTLRSSANTGYYQPNKDRVNLTVLTDTAANHIIFSKETAAEGLTAVGIEYTAGGQSTTVRARKEVILCAGSFVSPKILELSGIGDKNVLEAHGIPVLVDLPGVGENYQDHLNLPVVYEVDSSYETVEVLRDPARAAAEFKLYQETGKGMISVAGTSHWAFLPAGSYTDLDALKTALSNAADAEVNKAKLARETVKLQKEWLFADSVPQLELAPFPGFIPGNTKRPVPGKRYFSIVVALMHPFSRGSVHIASSDPSAAPTIDINLLENDVDIKMFVEGIKLARRVINAEGLNGIVGEEIFPGCYKEKELENAIRETAVTIYHPIGTCSILPREQGGVVDENLKVYGTNNVRVVDASVLPIHVSAHTLATVYAIAEKGADIIKASLA